MQAAAVVRGGKIWVIGGQVHNDRPFPRSDFVATTAVDVFDPAAKTWSPGPPLPADAPKNHLAVAVQDDVIYLLNGYVGPDTVTPSQTPTNVAYKLAAGASAWERLPDFPEMRGAGAAAQSIGGKLYVAGGGTDEMAALPDTFVFDPRASSWTKLTPIPTPRTHVASCAIGGKMLVFGGFRGSDETLATTEIFDVASSTWKAGPNMPTPRGAATAAVLGGGCDVIGGFRWAPAAISAAVERFDPATNRWTTLAPMLVARHSVATAALGTAIYALGGSPVPFAGASDREDLFTP
jgi:N-acetylneuraminic acid mutarotase